MSSYERRWCDASAEKEEELRKQRTSSTFMLECELAWRQLESRDRSACQGLQAAFLGHRVCQNASDEQSSVTFEPASNPPDGLESPPLSAAIHAESELRNPINLRRSRLNLSVGSFLSPHRHVKLIHFSRTQIFAARVDAAFVFRDAGELH